MIVEMTGDGSAAVTYISFPECSVSIYSYSVIVTMQSGCDGDDSSSSETSSGERVSDCCGYSIVNSS